VPSSGDVRSGVWLRTPSIRVVALGVPDPATPNTRRGSGCATNAAARTSCCRWCTTPACLQVIPSPAHQHMRAVGAAIQRRLLAGQHQPRVGRQRRADHGAIGMQPGRQLLCGFWCVACRHTPHRQAHSAVVSHARRPHPTSVAPVLQLRSPSASCSSSCTRPHRGPQRASLQFASPRSCRLRPGWLSLERKHAVVRCSPVRAAELGPGGAARLWLGM
jgi:hypothetical protein